MSNRSLAYHLGLYITLSLVVVFGIFIFWILRFHSETTRKNIEDRAYILSDDIYRNVRDRVVLTQELAAGIAKQIEFYHTHGETKNYLGDLLRDHPYLEAIQVKLHIHENVVDDSVFSVSGSATNFTCLEGKVTGNYPVDQDTLIKYFSDLKITGWSEPFRYKKTGDIVSVYHFPFIFRDSRNNVLSSGYVQCMISFSFLDNLINRIKIWETGYAFLISDKGTFITYPIKEMVLNRNLFNLPPGDIRGDSVKLQAFMQGKSGPITVYPPVLNHAKAFSFSNKIPENNWLLVTVIPFAELNRELYSLVYKMTGILLLLAGIVFFLIIAISSKVMKPLSEVSSELHQFSIQHIDLSPQARNETVTIRESLKRLQEIYLSNKRQEWENTSRNQRYKADLEVASEIQQSILPSPGHYSLHNDKIIIHSVFKPARIVSGDLYDFFMIDDQHLLIVIGDVSGGGVPAALFMGVAHTLIKSNALAGTAKEIVNQVNRSLCPNNTNQFFLTMFMGILHIGSGELNYCNAGHAPTFLQTANGCVRELADPHGLPLGLYSETEYRDSKVRLEPGDVLILYTDGITEQVNESGEYFGVSGFYQIFDMFKGRKPQDITDTIIRRVAEFAGKADHTNDLSLVVLKYS